MLFSSGRLGGQEALLCFLEVDDVPNGVEVLSNAKSSGSVTKKDEGRRLKTYVGLDVLVLEVECVLPNVDANERDVSCRVPFKQNFFCQ